MLALYDQPVIIQQTIPMPKGSEQHGKCFLEAAAWLTKMHRARATGAGSSITYLQFCKKAIYPRLQVGVRRQGRGQASLVYVQGTQGGVGGVCLQLLSNQLGDQPRRERHRVLLGFDRLGGSGMKHIRRRRMHVCRHTDTRLSVLTHASLCYDLQASAALQLVTCKCSSLH